MDEFAAHTRTMTVRAGQMHDPDGDAQVTKGEMTTMMGMVQSHMGGQQGGVQDMGHGMVGKT